MKLKSLRAIVTSPYIYKHVCVCPHRVCETIEIKCKNKVLKPNVFVAEREREEEKHQQPMMTKTQSYIKHAARHLSCKNMYASLS